MSDRNALVIEVDAGELSDLRTLARRSRMSLEEYVSRHVRVWLFGVRVKARGM